MFRKLTGLIITITSLYFSYSAPSQAEPCAPVGSILGGGANQYTVDYDVNATDFWNQPGFYSGAQNWGANANITCSCVTRASSRYYRTVAVLPPSTGSHPQAPSGLKWYKLNSYVDMALQLRNLPGNPSAPFDNVQANTSTSCNTPVSDSAMGQGTFYFYIMKPFVGAMHVVTPLFATYVSTTSGQFSNKPEFMIYVNSMVHSNNTCDVINDAGTPWNPVVINYDSIVSSDFTGIPGQPPVGFNKKETRLKFKCTGIDPAQALVVRMQTTPDLTNPKILQSDNPDIGIMIENKNGVVIDPNLIPFELTCDDCTNAITTRSFQFTSYPVSTTNNLPAPGKFTARANLYVEFP